MLLRILRETLRRRKRRVGVAILAVVVGSSLAAALLMLSLDVSEKVGRELKAYGANLLVTPRSEALGAGEAGVQDGEGSYLDDTELARLKTIFWRNNVVGFAPYLSAVVSVGDGGDRVALTGTWFDQEVSLPQGTRVRSAFSGQSTLAEEDRFRTGVKWISPWWRVQGNWVAEGDPRGAMVGASLAERLKLSAGDPLEVRYGQRAQRLRVEGIVSTGGLEEEQIFVNLPVAQGLLGLEKGASRVLVNAIVTPKEKIPEKLRNKKPEEMTPKEYETWYCTPTLESVGLQIEEVLSNSQARPIRQISEAEGSFISRIELLMALVTVVALVASTLAVMTTMTTTVLERRGEIGLMKAIGADGGQVAAIFLAEAGTIGLLGGSLGFLAGLLLARFIGTTVFAASVSPNPLVLPITLLLALGVAIAGSALPVRNAVRLQPAILLKGG